MARHDSAADLQAARGEWSGDIPVEWSGKRPQSAAAGQRGHSGGGGVVFVEPFTLDVNLTDGNPHEVAIYATDYDSSGRAERVDVLDSGTGTQLDTRNLSGFVNGQYLVWIVTGHVTIRITPTAGPNGVVNGNFLRRAFADVAAARLAGLVAFNRRHDICGRVRRGKSGRANGDDFKHGRGHAELDGEQDTVLADTIGGRGNRAGEFVDRSEYGGLRGYSSLAAGGYTDTVTIAASGAAGSPATVAVTLNVGAITTVSFLKLDTGTKGNWTAAYGAEGYDFVGVAPQLPAWVQLDVNGASTFEWTASSSQPYALQTLPGNNRVAAAWYSSSAFTLDMNLTDGNVHQVALYASDYDGSGRAERVDVLDSTTGTVLDTRTLYNFQTGQYLVWSVVGHAVFRVTPTSGPNGVVNGIFFGTSDQGALPPALMLSTSVLNFSATSGAANPVAQYIPITNAGGGSAELDRRQNSVHGFRCPRVRDARGSVAGSTFRPPALARRDLDRHRYGQCPRSAGSPATIGSDS